MIALLLTLVLAPLYDVQLVPAGQDSAPVALNGSRVLGNSASGPWIWEGGATVRYLFPGDTRQLVATGFNARGDVVGYEGSGASRRAFVYAGGVFTYTGTLGGTFSMALGVADGGRVAGDSRTASGRYHSFAYENGVMRDIGTLGGDETIILPGLPWTSATGVNGSGVIVGNVYNKPDYNGDHYDTFAYVYRDGAMHDLNELIPPSTFTLMISLGINDAGQILCTDGQVGQAHAYGYLLTPR